MTALAKPAPLQTVVDPELGTTIRRISNVGNGIIKPLYSPTQAWNADETGSPSGTRAVFASDWGGGATVDTYVVELPAYKN